MRSPGVTFLICSILFVNLCSAQPSKNGYRDVRSLYNRALGLISENPDSCEVFIDEIKKLSQEYHYEEGLLQAQLLEAGLLKRENDLDSAAHILHEVISKAQSLGENTYEEAKARLDLVTIYQRLSDLEKAEENGEVAVAIFESLDSVVLRYRAFGALGITNGMRGDYPEALTYFLQQKELLSDEAFTENQRQEYYSSLISNIGTVYSLMEQHDEALAYSKEGLMMDLQMGDSIGASRSYLIIGENYNAAGNVDSALHYSYLGVAFAERHIDNDPRYASVIYNGKQNIAAYLQKRGKYEEAISILRSSFKHRGENENYGIEDCYTMLGEFCQYLNQYDSALFFGRKAWVLAQNNSSKNNSRGAAKRLASIFFQQGRLDSAYHYRELYHAYNDSIYNDSNDRKFSNLRVKLETLEKENEIDNLTRQQEIDKANRWTLIISFIAFIIVAVATVIILVLRHRFKEKQREIRELELNKELQKHEMQIQHQTLHMINLSQNILEIEESLKEIKKKKEIPAADLQKVLSSIMVRKSMEKEWQQFETYFANIEQDFRTELKKRHENLTQQERRLASLIKLDLSNREVANLLNIELKSVTMSRYRLKQKLGLGENDDLETYIHNLQ